MRYTKHEDHADEVIAIFNQIADQTGVLRVVDLINDLTSSDMNKNLRAFSTLSTEAEDAYSKKPELHQHEYWFRCTLNASMPNVDHEESKKFALKIQKKLKVRLN